MGVRSVPENKISDDGDLEFLGALLSDLKLPESELPALSVVDITVVVDDDKQPSRHPINLRRPGVIDLSDIATIVSPYDLVRLRRTFFAESDGISMTDSANVHYPTPESFAHTAALSMVAKRRAEAAGDSGTTESSLVAKVAARICYFLGLSNDDFEACYDYRLEPSPEYLVAVRRADERLPSKTKPATTMRRRRAKARSLRGQPGSAET